MDFHVVYTQEALRNLAEIIGHIAEDDPEAASRFGTSLLDHVELLGRFPRMGTPIRKRRHVRKLLHSPILVYYKLNEDKHLSKFFISGTARVDRWSPDAQAPLRQGNLGEISSRLSCGDRLRTTARPLALPARADP